MDLLIRQILVIVDIEVHLDTRDMIEIAPSIVVILFSILLWRRDQRPRALVDPVAHRLVVRVGQEDGVARPVGHEVLELRAAEHHAAAGLVGEREPELREAEIAAWFACVSLGMLNHGADKWSNDLPV